VLAEAVIVGVIASAVGLGFGLVIALGLEGLLKAFGIGLPTTTLQVLPRTIVVALIVGTVTTVVASVVPAFRASRVSPMAALRDPRRTASTASALMIGLGLMAFVSIFAASIKASADRTLRETLKADYIVSTSQFVGFSPAVADALRSNPSFSAVEEFRQGSFG